MLRLACLILSKIEAMERVKTAETHICHLLAVRIALHFITHHPELQRRLAKDCKPDGAQSGFEQPSTAAYLLSYVVRKV